MVDDNTVPLRGCDVVALKVEDLAPHGYAIDRATVRQRKTGRPVKFELTDQTRGAVDDYLRAAGKKPGEFLFTGSRGRLPVTAPQATKLRTMLTKKQICARMTDPQDAFMCRTA